MGGGGGGSGCGLLLPDGGITFPLVVDTVIVGVLTIWRHGERGTGASRGTQRGPLSPAECECAAAVARSLALSTMLDQRLLWSGMHADSRTEEALLSQVSCAPHAKPSPPPCRTGTPPSLGPFGLTLRLPACRSALPAAAPTQVGHSLRTSVHQLGSPLAALQLFSKLILRRLPPSDSATRQLVREIVSQAGRAQQLVGPLQALASQLPPLRRPELAGAPGEGADGGVAVGGGLPAHGSAGASVLGERQLLWLPDLLRPLAVSFSQLAAAQGARLEWRLDEDAPPVRACELEVREAVSNLLENALRYGTGLLALSLVPIHALPSEAADAAAERAAAREEEGGGERELEGMPDGVCLFVWNSGPGIAEAELARVFEPGFRGVRSQQPGARGGSGLGLSIARELIAALGGGIALRNAPAPLWLRERGLPVRAELLQSGTLAQIVLPRARFSSRSRAATDLI